MDQTNSNLIIIAPEHSYSIKLIQYLIKHFNNDELIFDKIDEEHQKIGTQLLINTKYYTCDVDLHTIKYNYFNQVNALEQLQKIKVDGVIFIVDANNMNGLDQFINLCDQILNEIQPGLQAIIYNRKEGVKINFELLENEEKKLESFVEQIYLDLENPPIQQQIKQLSEQQDETLGFPRIIEIIECNTWTYMRPKSQEKKENINKTKVIQNKKQGLDQLEYEDDQFAQLIHDMTKIRTSKMTDEERREKAANLMNQLMNMCQDDDEDDL
ncbi:unnamed protein product [Paramecium primaurelia]|uniref:Uncharacterized protein n=1 Tax=Paramecium primaurelia TaxID=5886 RepID=A0A8S1PE58_PARPR|nr:unnamed protein product [Paramecium primaurelia]